MNPNDIIFRQAKDTDVEAAVPLIYSSGPAAFDFAFKHSDNRTALDFLVQAFTHTSGQFSHVNHTVATLGDEVVGIGTAFSGRDVLGYNLSAFGQIVSFYGAIAAAGIAIRGLRTERVIPPPKGLEHYIANLGVSPNLRSRGIGAKLVHELLEQGRKLGRPKATLHVAHGNDRAQALYERLGFIVTHEIPSNLENEHARVPGHRKMELPL